MIYINFIDNEEDTTDYEQFILTKVDCKDLIKECIVVYNDMSRYDTVSEFLTDYDFADIKIDNRIMAHLQNHLDCDNSYFGNAWEFTMDILEDAGVLVDDYWEVTEVYY